MDTVLAISTALSLATAAGLNAYIPLLVVGLLARYTSLISLSGPYEVLTNPWVLLVIAVLLLIDMVGDKIPAVDNFFHAAGVIIHPVAGALLGLASSNAIGGIDPTLAAVAGLLVALGTHGARATARPVVTATTAGVGNPVVSIAEDATSLTLSVLAIAVPFIAAGLIIVLTIAGFLGLRRLFRRRPTDNGTH